MEEVIEIIEGVDGNSYPTHLTERLTSIGGEADLGWKIECNGESGLSLLKQVSEPLVGLGGGGVAGVLAHRPEFAPIHARVNSSGEGELAGARFSGIIAVERIDGDSAGALKALGSFRMRGYKWFPAFFLPA